MAFNAECFFLSCTVSVFRENPYKVCGSDVAGTTILSVHVLGDSLVLIRCTQFKTEILLRGDERLSTNSNSVIFDAVQKYIQKRKRFRASK